MTNIFSDIVIRAAQLAGSHAVTEKGRAKAILHSPRFFYAAIQEKDKICRKKISNVLDRLPVGTTIELQRDTTYGYWFSALPDNDAQSLARNELGKCGQRTNYGDGVPQVYGKASQVRWTSITYRKWKPGSHAHRDYQSCVGITNSGKSAVVIVSCVFKRRIIAPKDLRFDYDVNGILVRRTSDKMDFHPESKDWLRKDFWTYVRKQLATNYLRRVSTRKIERNNRRFNTIMERQLPSCFVTMNDSRAAGNCIEGSISFAVARLGVSRDDIINGGHLFGVVGRKLLATNDIRARAAVIQAWKRETIVSI